MNDRLSLYFITGDQTVSGNNPFKYKACLNKLATRSLKDPHPLVIGTQRFDTEYMQSYRDKVKTALNYLRKNSPEIPPRSFYQGYFL